MFERHSVSREGVMAGLIGATAVALWFLVIDTVAGRAFHTPDQLGASLMSVLGPRGSEGIVTHVLFYTVFHYAVFIGVGVVLAWLFARADGYDLGTVTIPHPLLGPLTLYQWLVMVVHHEARHTEQVAEVAATHVTGEYRAVVSSQ
jgi:hypothetical protein